MYLQNSVMPGDWENSIKKIHADLRQLFQIPLEQQGFAWARQVYDLAPQAFFEIKGQITDPDGRSYIAAKLCENIHIDQIQRSMANPDQRIAPDQEMYVISFDNLAYEAIRGALGIAIISSEGNVRPDALIRFGSVWSYMEYGDLAGNGNVLALFQEALEINPESPFDAIAKETERYTISTPSEAFFPQYVRDLICDEIKYNYPDSNPDIKLLYEEKYTLSYTIMVMAGVPQEAKAQLQSALTWYMPPYLPIILN